MTESVSLEKITSVEDLYDKTIIASFCDGYGKVPVISEEGEIKHHDFLVRVKNEGKGKYEIFLEGVSDEKLLYAEFYGKMSKERFLELQDNLKVYLKVLADGGVRIKGIGTQRQGELMKRILRKNYGLGGQEQQTLREISDVEGRTPQRMQQIREAALRVLRHKTRDPRGDII